VKYQEQVVQLVPDNSAAWRELSRLYVAAGQQENAARTLRRAEQEESSTVK
jgi:hypothetical protein